MPQMAKTYPAGVIKVGFRLETSAVVFPPMRVVLPAKLLTRTVKTKAIRLVVFRRIELAEDIFSP